MADASSEPRSKRARLDKGGRFAALERLKNLKGNKNKYEVESEVDNVYEIVDEREYAKRAQERYGGDWIDDDCTGYAEDGRDFFEDDDDYSGDEEQSTKSGQKDKKTAGKKRPRESEKPAKGKSSIRNLFKNAVPKRAANAKLADDEILADILSELKDDGSSKNESKPIVNKVIAPAKIISIRNEKSEVELAKKFMSNFAKNVNITEQVKRQANHNESNDDDELSERVLQPKEVVGNVAKKFKPDTVKDVPSSPVKPTITAEKDSKSAELIEMEALDVDFSCLQDVENQFENEKIEKVAEPTVVKGVAKSKAEVPTPVAMKSNVEYEPASKPTMNNDDLQSILSNWEDICQTDNFMEEIEAKSVSSPAPQKKLPDKLKFWYWDINENARRSPGEVFLFGKTAEGESVTVRVRNIDRVLFLLPREYLLDPITKVATKQKVTVADIHKEFNEDISRELGLKSFRSRKVTKNFAYHSVGIDIPQECDYMEVRYDGRKAAPNVKKRYNSIAYIFGANTTPLERFLLDRKIKGPCWLNLEEYVPHKVPVTWCKVEVSVDNPRQISIVEQTKSAPPPPLTLLTLNVRTTVSPRTNKNEICMISMLVQNRFQIDKPAPQRPFNNHMCGFTRPATRNWAFDLNAQLEKFKSTRVYKHDSEKSLMNWFLAQFQRIDADLIVTFDMEDCQLNIIAERIATCKVPQWSRLGRLRLSENYTKSVMDSYVGRMICDVRHSAEECIRSRSYDLQTLCQNVLKLSENARTDLNMENIDGMYETGEGIIKLITLTMQDASYILRMMYELNLMPLALQLTNICGNVMNRTLLRGRNERNEFLLLHAFTEKNYIVPDKKVREWHNGEMLSDITGGPGNTTTRKKAAYAGGMVLDPIRGLYDKYVLLMDFNSLYPSIIQEYNICFTTVQPPYDGEDLPTLPAPGTEVGILPQQLRRLVDSRREVKKLMAAPDVKPEQYQQYHIRQMALKLTANSMYGCLGFGSSRFNAQHLAALVTHKGREILMNTKSLVEKMNYTVVYGDTDSIMVNTNITDYDQVFKIGHGIKQSVNKIYKQLELDIDGVFSCLLLLKKKKYAAVKVSKNKKGELVTEQEHKGLDIVRRDWSQVAVMVGKYVLDEILSEKQLDEKLDAVHSKLEEIKDNIEKNEVPMSMFAITIQLSKNPTEFKNTTSMPHVQVALRMNSTRNRRYKKGDMVDYVICEDGTKNPAMQRAYHLDELKSSETLKVDNNYYLSHQIHPVVTRMVEVLDGTDAARIAGCLGLDESKFKNAAQKSHEERSEDTVGESIIKTTLQKYRLCEKFQFTCVTCKAENIVASAFKPSTKVATDANHSGADAVLQNCSNPECSMAPYQYVIAIRNQLILAMRKYIKRFYQNWLVCDDPVCNRNTRAYTHVTFTNRPVCFACKNGTLVRQYTERDLFNQLTYFQYMFDLSKHQYRNIKLSTEVENAYHVLRETVDQQLNKSSYSTIALSKLFARFKPLEKSVKVSNNKVSLPICTVATSLEDE